MARLPQKVDARYERLKRAEREGGSVPLSKATMRYVAKTAVDGQFAFFEDALAREYALRHQSRIARLKRQANFPRRRASMASNGRESCFPAASRGTTGSRLPSSTPTRTWCSSEDQAMARPIPR